VQNCYRRLCVAYEACVTAAVYMHALPNCLAALYQSVEPGWACSTADLLFNACCCRVHLCCRPGPCQRSSGFCSGATAAACCYHTGLLE
jgi:hypothetical protein